MNNDDLIKDIYNKNGNTSQIWKHYSENLIKSSENIYEKYSNIDFEDIESVLENGELLSYSKIVNMLRAMALECLFKALWLKSGELNVENNRLKKITGANDHNLKKLAEIVSDKIDLNVNEEENEILNRLSLYMSAGRYPISTDWKNYNIQDQHWGSSDNILFENLLKRLNEIFEKKESE
ncbi:hypothetical protein ACFL6K_00935 [Candidatus Latescibacterota bacterium]